MQPSVCGWRPERPWQTTGVSPRVQKLKNLEFNVQGQEASSTGERQRSEDSANQALPRSSPCFYSTHAVSWLDGADWGWVCLSQSTDSNVNLLWQHPHRHTQEQYFASFNQVDSTNHHIAQECSPLFCSNELALGSAAVPDRDTSGQLLFTAGIWVEFCSCGHQTST